MPASFISFIWAVSCCSNILDRVAKKRRVRGSEIRVAEDNIELTPATPIELKLFAPFCTPSTCGHAAADFRPTGGLLCRATWQDVNERAVAHQGY